MENIVKWRSKSRERDKKPRNILHVFNNPSIVGRNPMPPSISYSLDFADIMLPGDMAADDAVARLKQNAGFKGKPKRMWLLGGKAKTKADGDHPSVTEQQLCISKMQMGFVMLVLYCQAAEKKRNVRKRPGKQFHHKEQIVYGIQQQFENSNLSF